MNCGDAAATTWRFRGDESRRRGCPVEYSAGTGGAAGAAWNIPRRRAAPRMPRGIFRGDGRRRGCPVEYSAETGGAAGAARIFRGGRLRRTAFRRTTPACQRRKHDRKRSPSRRTRSTYRYRLPLWDDPGWRALLDPVFECCGVPRDRVIRCLLASMPPRTVIPPHHDSGYWVPRSRRLHVAIKTQAGVVFRAGRTLGSMKRVRFAEGCVVELNNQAKHYVRGPRRSTGRGGAADAPGTAPRRPDGDTSQRQGRLRRRSRT